MEVAHPWLTCTDFHLSKPVGFSLPAPQSTVRLWETTACCSFLCFLQALLTASSQGKWLQRNWIGPERCVSYRLPRMTFTPSMMWWASPWGRSYRLQPTQMGISLRATLGLWSVCGVTKNASDKEEECLYSVLFCYTLTMFPKYGTRNIHKYRRRNHHFFEHAQWATRETRSIIIFTLQNKK